MTNLEKKAVTLVARHFDGLVSEQVVDIFVFNHDIGNNCGNIDHLLSFLLGVNKLKQNHPEMTQNELAEYINEAVYDKGLDIDEIK